jgi:hypothetical protein
LGADEADADFAIHNVISGSRITPLVAADVRRRIRAA